MFHEGGYLVVYIEEYVMGKGHRGFFCSYELGKVFLLGEFVIRILCSCLLTLNSEKQLKFPISIPYSIKLFHSDAFADLPL